MAQSTAGIALKYVPDNTPTGWDPTGVGADLDDLTGTWVTIEGITEMPEIGATPDTLETTTLTNEEYKTYIPGLLDTGGVLTFKANDSDTFRDAIDDLELALAGKVWFAIELPDPIGQSLVFSGTIAPLGFGGAGPNSVLMASLNIIPDCEPIWFDNATGA